MEIKIIPPEVQLAIEKELIERREAHGLKGKKALQHQTDFIIGACAALSATLGSYSVPPAWYMKVGSGRLIERSE